MARINEGARNKKKGKAQEKRKHPYKAGGRFRSSAISDTENKSEEVMNKKKGRKK